MICGGRIKITKKIRILTLWYWATCGSIFFYFLWMMSKYCVSIKCCVKAWESCCANMLQTEASVSYPWLLFGALLQGKHLSFSIQGREEAGSRVWCQSRHMTGSTHTSISSVNNIMSTKPFTLPSHALQRKTLVTLARQSEGWLGYMRSLILH